MTVYFSDDDIDRLIAEDLPYGDLTTRALGIGDQAGRIVFSARNPLVLAGAEVAARVAVARALQTERYRSLGLPGVACNAAAPANVIETIAVLDGPGTTLMREAAERLRLSARGYHRVLKLARTLADLDGAADIGRVHLAEALSYRGQSALAARAA